MARNAISQEKARRLVHGRRSFHPLRGSESVTRADPEMRDAITVDPRAQRRLHVLSHVLIADDVRTAHVAAGLVRVEYETRPGVYSYQEALAPGAPLVQ